MEHMCSQCRAGEISRPADYLVKGKIQGDYRMLPYKAYICNDHYLMLLTDEANLKIVEYISQEAIKIHADELTRYYTAYGSFKELCKNNPTLLDFPEANWLKKQYQIFKGA